MRFSGRYEGYSLANLQKDMLAGLVVGIVAIPLAMAFAIACGVRPEYGIYTTIIAGILVSIFGGSKYQIAGYSRRICTHLTWYCDAIWL